MNELSGLLQLMLVVSTLGSARGTGCDPDIPSRPPPQQTPGPKSSYGAGQFKDVTTQSCLPCPPDTFMTKLMVDRGFGTCEKCLEPVRTELEVKRCTSERDSEMMCQRGSYRHISGSICEGKCELCEICGLGNQLSLNYDTQECEGFNKTICCSKDNMVIVNGECADPSAIQHPTSAATTRHSVTTLPATTTYDSQSKHSENVGTRNTLEGNMLRENTSPDNKQHSTKILTDSTVTQSPLVRVGPNESTSPTKGPHHVPDLTVRPTESTSPTKGPHHVPGLTVRPTASTSSSPTKGPPNVPGLTVGLVVSTSTLLLVSALLGSALVYYIKKEKSAASLAVTGSNTYNTPDVDAHHYFTLGSPTTNQPQQIHVLSIQDPRTGGNPGDRNEYSTIPDYIEVF